MNNYFYFDLETDSLLTYKAKIIQIGFIYQGISKEILVNPQKPIAVQASNVNKIYDDDVKNAPIFSQIAPKLMKILEECDAYVTFNGDSYDLPILALELQRCGYSLPDKISLDVFKMVQMYEGSKKLSDVYLRYTGKTMKGAHQALCDVNGTMEVFNFLQGKNT